MKIHSYVLHTFYCSQILYIYIYVIIKRVNHKEDIKSNNTVPFDFSKGTNSTLKITSTDRAHAESRCSDGWTKVSHEDRRMQDTDSTRKD